MIEKESVDVVNFNIAAAIHEPAFDTLGQREMIKIKIMNYELMRGEKK